MRPTQSLRPVSGLPYSRRSLQVVVSPCWEKAVPDVISAIPIEVSGPLPRRTLPVHLSVSSWKTSASRYGLGVQRAKNSLQGNFYRDRFIEAAIIRLCSDSPTCSTHRLHPPSHLEVLGGRALYTTQNLGCYLPKQWHRYMTEPDNCHSWTFTSWIAALSAAPSREAVWGIRG